METTWATVNPPREKSAALLRRARVTPNGLNAWKERLSHHEDRCPPIHHQATLRFSVAARSFIEITQAVAEVVTRSGAGVGLVTVFVRHTSASLLLQENADPDVLRDLESFFSRLVPDGDPLYRHCDEGPDDMSAHIRSALTAVTLGIPICDGQMVLGTWQGIYLWEHRTGCQQRQVVVHVSGHGA